MEDNVEPQVTQESKRLSGILKRLSKRSSIRSKRGSQRSLDEKSRADIHLEEDEEHEVNEETARKNDEDPAVTEDLNPLDTSKTEEFHEEEPFDETKGVPARFSIKSSRSNRSSTRSSVRTLNDRGMEPLNHGEEEFSAFSNNEISEHESTENDSGSAKPQRVSIKSIRHSLGVLDNGIEKTMALVQRLSARSVRSDQEKASRLKADQEFEAEQEALEKEARQQEAHKEEEATEEDEALQQEEAASTDRSPKRLSSSSRGQDVDAIERSEEKSRSFKRSSSKRKSTIVQGDDEDDEGSISSSSSRFSRPGFLG